LPFVNLDGSDTTKIFANGLADDVITRLSRVPGLLVSSRGDAFTLEPNSASQKIRERLRVAMYLEGSVQMLGDEIRVIVQLIDSETGFHVLSRTFDRRRDDFFDVRDEITELTVANVRVALPPDTQNVSKVDSDEPSLDAYILFRRGVEAFQLPSTESISVALDWFDAALAIDSDYAAAHAGKCAVYAHRYSDVVDSSFIDKAESSCATALELNPNLDVVYAAMGELYQTTGKYDDAVQAYTQALETNPSNVEALTGIGIVYSLQQQPDEAERYLRSATGLHPGDWSAYNELGNFLFNSGRYLAAAEQYEAVVALDRGNDVGFANLGTAYMLAGDFTAAAPALQKAIAIEERPTTYSNLGIMLYYLGDFESAIAAYRRATELAPNYHLGWSNLGDALWADAQPEVAADAFATAEALANEALLVNPNDPGVLMDLAWIKAMLDQSDDASTLIDKALSLAPDDPYAHYINGLVSLRAGNVDGALVALTLAVESGYSVDMMAAEPHLNGLHDDPRFSDVLNTSAAP
jgi:adenylate cyclase